VTARFPSFGLTSGLAALPTMISSKRIQYVFPLVFFCGTWLLVRTCSGAGQGPAPEYSLEEIRVANAEARGRLQSLSMEYESDDKHSQSSTKVRVVIAVRGASRYVSAVHFTSDFPPELDLKTIGTYFDGANGALTQFYPNLLYCDTFRKTAARVSWKARGDFFLECTGWWPSGDLDPDNPRLGTYLHKVLADPRSRLLPRKEEVDGAWCHVVERPGIDKWWLDSQLGFAPRRREWEMGDGDIVLPLHYLLSDYREAAPKIWVPWHLERQVFKQRPKGAGKTSDRERFALAEVKWVEVNRVRADQFQFEAPPGAVVKDQDTGEVTQLPGGLLFLDSVADRQQKRAAIFQRLAATRDNTVREEKSDVLLILSIILMFIICLALTLKILIAWRTWSRHDFSHNLLKKSL
jgi:hypothetical protein